MKRSTALVIGLITFQAMLAVVVIASPESLGLTPVIVNWMAVINVGCGVFLNQIERLGGDSRQVEVETVTQTREMPGRPPDVQTVTTERTKADEKVT